MRQSNDYQTMEDDMRTACIYLGYGHQDGEEEWTCACWDSKLHLLVESFDGGYAHYRVDRLELSLDGWNISVWYPVWNAATEAYDEPVWVS